MVVNTPSNVQDWIFPKPSNCNPLGIASACRAPAIVSVMEKVGPLVVYWYTGILVVTPKKDVSLDSLKWGFIEKKRIFEDIWW